MTCNPQFYRNAKSTPKTRWFIKNATDNHQESLRVNRRSAVGVIRSFDSSVVKVCAGRIVTSPFSAGKILLNLFVDVYLLYVAISELRNDKALLLTESIYTVDSFVSPYIDGAIYDYS